MGISHNDIMRARFLAADNVLYLLDEASKPIAVVAGVVDPRFMHLLATSPSLYNAITQLGEVLEAMIDAATQTNNEVLAGQLTQLVSDIQLVKRSAIEGATAVFVDSQTRKDGK